MLYLEGKTSKVWQTLVRVLSQRESLDLVVCLYPEANIDDLPKPLSLDGSSDDLERVTTYGDGNKPRCSARFHVNEDLLRMLDVQETELETLCDNFALYRPGELTWLACSIPHEGMSLVRDKALLPELQQKGLAVSDVPPSWW